MVGKIFKSYFRYFDKVTKEIKIKSRPVLIVAEPTGFDTEYTVLPVSSLLNPAFYRQEYDVDIKLCDFPKLKLDRNSYIRAHKQTVIYRADIDFNRSLGDLKTLYPDAFYEVLRKMERYQTEIISRAENNLFIGA